MARRPFVRLAPDVYSPGNFREGTMQKSVFGVMSSLLVAMATAAQSPHTPRGTATDVSRAEVEATVQKTASAPVSDQAIRVVSINGEYNVGVGVVHRSKTDATATGGSVEHS